MTTVTKYQRAKRRYYAKRWIYKFLRRTYAPSLKSAFNYKRLNKNKFVLDVLLQVYYPTNTGTDMSYPLLRLASNEMTLGGGYHNISIHGILGYSGRWDEIKGLYEAYKIYAVDLECMVHTREVAGQDDFKQHCIFLCVCQGSNNLPNDEDKMLEVPKCITLTPRTTYVRKFKRMSSDWAQVGTLGDVPPYLLWFGHPQNPAGPMWDIHMRVYIAMKNTMV